jgi:hypothetical protein
MKKLLAASLDGNIGLMASCCRLKIIKQLRTVQGHPLDVHCRRWFMNTVMARQSDHDILAYREKKYG